MFARKRAPRRLNLYFCISECDRKMFLSVLGASVYEGEMVKKRRKKVEERKEMKTSPD